MSFLRALFALLFALVTLPIRLLFRLGSGGNVVELPDDDPGMAAARAEALATLPEFLRRFSAPGADLSSAAIKAPLVVGGGTEHVWVNDLRYENGDFLGTLDNAPRGSALRSGEPMRVPAATISDWKLVEKGRLVGGFTIRYLVSRMPEKQRDAVLAGLPFAMDGDPIPPSV
jgi:uncharacterized protein YegJ (DUF2314 family)